MTLVLGGVPRVAPAADAEQWQVSAQVAYASVLADGRRPPGGLVGVDLQYGLTDAWAARLSLASSAHPVTADAGRPGGAVGATSVSLGLTYAVDVLRFVPVIELGIGLLDLRGAINSPRRDVGLQLGIGGDYLLTRAWAVGLMLRYQHFPLQVAGLTPGFEGIPVVFSIGPRISYIF